MWVVLNGTLPGRVELPTFKKKKKKKQKKQDPTDGNHLNEPPVVQTWTIPRVCTSPHTCVGEVKRPVLDPQTPKLAAGGNRAVGDYWYLTTSS